MGCETWPDDSEFSICVVCNQPTQRIRGVTPLPYDDAMSAQRHAEFENYYANEHVPVITPLTDAELGISIG